MTRVGHLEDLSSVMAENASVISRILINRWIKFAGLMKVLYITTTADRFTANFLLIKS